MSGMPPAPRVNKAYMAKHIGKAVTLVGKLVSAEGSKLTVEACDGGSVLVSLQDGMTPGAEGAMVEVLGICRDENTIAAERIASFGKAEGFSTENYNKLVQIAHERVPELFIE